MLRVKNGCFAEALACPHTSPQKETSALLIRCYYRSTLNFLYWIALSILSELPFLVGMIPY
jgi:hypothetical protein